MISSLFRVLAVLSVVGGLAALTVGASEGAGSASGLFVVSPNGGKPRTIVAGCIESFAWSPDGSSIAVARLVKDNAPEDETVVVNVKTDRARLIAMSGRPEPPAWSPDGSKIAFGEDDSGIYVASSAGTAKPRKLTRSDYWPAWSPNGKHIASSSFSQQIALVRPDGSSPKYLTRPKVIGLDVPVLWFPDGDRLLSANENLLTVNADGTGFHRLASTAVGGRASYAIAPNTGLIAYSQDDDQRIYLIKPDGSGKRFLTRGMVGGWSSDGTRLVFTHPYGGGVYVINLNGTGERKVAARTSLDGFYSGQPLAAWSSKGQIAYVYTAGSCGGPS